MTNAATNIGLPTDGLGTIVNDQHSRLNATAVKRIIRPGSLVQLSETIKAACARKLHLSIAGGRHAMGGQQFLQNGILLDMTALDRVLEFNDAARMVRCEAGATWPRLLSQLEQIQAGASTFWTFAQKQSGADNLTLGGAISANIHGRGLTFGPFVEHVVSIDIVTSDGKLVTVSSGWYTPSRCN